MGRDLCRGNLAHGGQKRRFDELLKLLDRFPHVDAVGTAVRFEVHVHGVPPGGSWASTPISSVTASSNSTVTPTGKTSSNQNRHDHYSLVVVLRTSQSPFSLMTLCKPPVTATRYLENCRLPHR